MVRWLNQKVRICLVTLHWQGTYTSRVSMMNSLICHLYYVAEAEAGEVEREKQTEWWKSPFLY